MHGDLESLFGGHELIHQETAYHDMNHHNLHEPEDDIPFLALGAADAAMQTFHFGSSFAHLPHDTHDVQGWHDFDHVNQNAPLHLLRHSEARDSNADGVSDAASRDLGLDPYSSNYHSPVDVNWYDAGGHLHSNQGKDSDGDGWSDDLESAIGTDPFSAASHPSLVEAHHFPAGSDENLPGTLDAIPSSAPWYSL